MRALRAWIFVVAVAGGADAQTPLSYLHGALLDRSPIIVRAQLDRDTTVAAARFLTMPFLVRKIFRGATESRILVRTPAERLNGAPDLEKILFLRGLPSGAIFDLVDQVDVTADDEEVVPLMLARYLALSSDQRLDERLTVRRTLAWVGLESRSMFGRKVGLRELRAVVAESRTDVDPLEPDRFQRLSPLLPKADAMLAAEVLAMLQSHAFGDFAPLVAAEKNQEERLAWVAVIAAWRAASAEQDRLRILEDLCRARGARAGRFLPGTLQDSSAAVRSRAAYWIGEFGDPDALGALQKGLRLEPGLEALQRIEAIGKLGDPEAFMTLRGALAHRDLLEVTLTAIARIGGPEAELLLQTVHAQLARDPAGESFMPLLLRLRSPEFSREESARRARARRAHHAH